jgi:hypothetical protein
LIASYGLLWVIRYFATGPFRRKLLKNPVPRPEPKSFRRTLPHAFKIKLRVKAAEQDVRIEFLPLKAKP